MAHSWPELIVGDQLMSVGLHLTVAEFDRMAEQGAFDHLNRKIELIRGELREMNPAGPFHDGLITYLTNWSVLAAAPHAMLVTSQTGLSLPELESRPEPDLLWLRNANYRTRHPTAADVVLAIEVSHSSLRFDLTEKCKLYAEAGINEYWIVDANERCLHVFRQPRNGSYGEHAIATLNEVVSPLAVADAKLDIGELFTDEP